MLNYSTAPTTAHIPLDRVFAAMADPARQAMIERLSHGPASVSELAKPLAMSLAGVMQHLAVLEASGVVRSQKQGRVRTCHLEKSALKRADDWIAQRKAALEHQLDRLETFLTSQGEG